MNRGFGFYFGHAIKSSCKTLWHKGNLLKYLAWVIMELLAPFTLVLGAMFSLANVRQAKIAERENTIDVPQSFKVACRAKPFWTMFLATVLEALIFIAGVILIGIVSLILGAIGYAISLFVGNVTTGLIVMIFCIPGGLMLAVYSVIMPILLAPTAYIIETNPDIGAADAISICFNTMKSRGKGTYFLTNFVTLLIEGAFLGLGIGVEFVLMAFVEDAQLATVLMILVGIIFFVGFVLVAPMFSLARKISQKNLFEDIVLDPVNASKHTSGVNIRKCKGVKFDPAEYENELALLFDETYSDRVPVPENPAALRKKKLDERTAARAGYAKTETPAYTPAPADAAAEEEDGELLTVSDLIRDVEPTETKAEEVEAPAEAAKEDIPAPVEVQPETAEEALAEEHAPAAEEDPPAAEPEKAEEPAAPAEPAPAVAPEKEEAPAKEPAQPAPVKKPATRTAATKPAATKTSATKTTTTKTTATVKPAAAKTTATKTAATKSTATKTTATVKPAATKPAATKTTATVKAKTAEKTSATKTTATVKAKTTTTKKTASKPADGDK